MTYINHLSLQNHLHTQSRREVKFGYYKKNSSIISKPKSVMLVKWGLGVLMLLGNSHVYAADYCVPTSTLVPELVLNPPSTTSNQIIKKGTQINTFYQLQNRYIFKGCGVNTSLASFWARPVKTPIDYAYDWSPKRGIYPTGVPGIGYSVFGRSSEGTSVFSLFDGPGDTGRRLHQGVFSEYMGAWMSVTFWATQDILPGVYTVPRQRVAMMRPRDYYATSIDGSPGGTSYAVIAGFTLTVKAATCDLATGDTNRTITLPNVTRADFIEKSTGKTNFEITANCSNASNVNFRFTGAASSNDPWRFANTGTANGVDLWLYSRIAGTDQTITANGDNNSRSIAVSSNRAVLPLGAAYFHTGSGAVNAGTLRSVVTVNITYN